MIKSEEKIDDSKNNIQNSIHSNNQNSIQNNNYNSNRNIAQDSIRVKNQSKIQDNIQNNIPLDKNVVEQISTIDFDNLINKIENIILLGSKTKMKKKDAFENTLKITKNILKENKVYLSKLRKDANMIKIFYELNETIENVRSKLNKLNLVKFCRSRAEKYVVKVTQKLENINMILLSFLAGSKTEVVIQDNGDLYNQIGDLNDRIAKLGKSDLNAVPKKEEKQFESNEEKLYKGLKYLRGVNSRVNYKLAYECFSQVSENDNYNTESKILLGEMYEKGYYLEQSYTNAYYLYKDAHDLGNCYGTFKIGIFAENGFYDINSKNLEKDYKDYDKCAMSFYLDAGEKGCSDALAKLGVIFDNGLLGNNVNKNLALEYYQKSIDIDENPIGLNGFGNHYYSLYKDSRNKFNNEEIIDQKGELEKMDDYAKKAIEYFTKSAKYGNVDSINNLGTCYEYGIGVEKSLIKAMYYYDKGAKFNHPISITNKAILLIKQNLIEQSDCFDECFKLLQFSISLDKFQHEPYYYLGLLFEMGYDMFKNGNLLSNPLMAFLNYKKAAELGNTNAKTKVGVAIYNGIENFFRHDETKGINLLKEASSEGDKEAEEYLNMLRNNGKKI